MRQLSRVTRAARLCGAAISVLLALACAPDARAQAGRSATRTWVSATGSSTNPCTREAPCRDLASAVAAVAEGGEVLILDSGSYDAVEITKSVRIVAPEGVHAVVAPATGAAIPGALNGETAAVLVNAADATVTLRNIRVAQQGSVWGGITALSVGALHVENCSVDGFPQGVFMQAKGLLMLRDSAVRNGGTGVYVSGSSSGLARASIDGCRLENNDAGLVVSNYARVTATRTAATGNGGNSDIGFYVALPGAELICDGCVATYNARGFYVLNNGVLRVARSTATYNNAGFYNDGGTLRSLAGTNMIDGNKLANRVGPITTFSADAP
jgi:hypothetical protein